MTTDARHLSAIRKVGVALEALGPALPQAMVARIVEEVPAYAAAGQTVQADVLELATATTAALNRALAEVTPVQRNDVPVIREHAGRRLRQGIELEAFLHAYRTALFRYWDACAEQASRLRLPSAGCLALARFALDAIDTITTHAAEAYLREDSRLRAADGRAARDLVDRLIAGQPVDTVRVRAVAPRLDAAGRLTIVVGQVDAGESGADALQSAADVLQDAWPVVQGRTVVALRQGEVVAVTGTEAPPGTAAAVLARARDRREVAVRFGVSVAADGFTGVPRAYREAAASVAYATPQRPVVALHELSPMQLVLLGADAPARTLLAGKRAAIPDTDRLTTLETVRAFADADMNVARAAEALFVHPNTVRYRLARIGEATGYDPRTFSGLADLKCVLGFA